MKALRRRALFLLWWPLLLGLWALLVSPRSLAEMLAGTGFAAIAAVAFETVRREGALRLRARAGWLRLLLRLPLQVLIDTVIVFRALGGLARGRSLRGELRSIPFSAGAAGGGRPLARRAFAVWLVSAAPNTIAVDLDLEADVMLVHWLEGRARPPLGVELAEESP
jgi:multisubunit Na+/H+ antiporter MnhE subunit